MDNELTPQHLQDLGFNLRKCEVQGVLSTDGVIHCLTATVSCRGDDGSGTSVMLKADDARICPGCFSDLSLGARATLEEYFDTWSHLLIKKDEVIESEGVNYDTALNSAHFFAKSALIDAPFIQCDYASSLLQRTLEDIINLVSERRALLAADSYAELRRVMHAKPWDGESFTLVSVGGVSPGVGFSPQRAAYEVAFLSNTPRLSVFLIPSSLYKACLNLIPPQHKSVKVKGGLSAAELDTIRHLYAPASEGPYSSLSTTLRAAVAV